ncbi:MAG TPA: oligosaccharide flippase family protein [Aggregatilineales bacterium]|nr:oligosaccharide flippase family protein [Aggregatilineales bacterium]
MLVGRLRRSTGLLLISNVGSAGFAFLISVVIGRLLGERGLGIYSTSLAWVYPVSILADAGINTLLTREAARSPELEPALLKASLQARWLIAGGLALALFTLAPLLSVDADVVRGIQLSAPLVFLLPTFGLYTAVFRARQAMWPIPILNLGMLTAQAGLTALILLRGGTVTDAFIINTLTSAGQVPVAWWIYRQQFQNQSFTAEEDSTQYPSGLASSPPGTPSSTPQGKLRADAEMQSHFRLDAGRWRLIALLSQAYPFAVAGVLAAIQARVTILLLERGATPEAVGQLAGAIRLTEAGRILPNAFFGALLPMLAALVAQPNDFLRLLRRVYSGILLYGLALAGMFGLGASTILQVTYGPSFERGTLALQLMGLALVPGLMRAVQTLAAYAHGREAQVNRLLLLGLVVQGMVAIWLIPIQGAAGAAASLLVSEVVMVIGLWRYRE